MLRLAALLLALPVAAQAQPERPGLGFAFVPGPEGLLVTAVAQDGPAAQTRLSPGAVVRQVGFVDVAGMAPDSLRRVIENAVGDGGEVRLSLWPRTRVSEIDVTPAPYSREALGAQIAEIVPKPEAGIDRDAEMAVLAARMRPAGYTARLRADTLTVASGTCTTAIPLARVAAVHLSEGRFLKLVGWGLTADCGDGPAGRTSALFPLAEGTDGPPAARAARRLASAATITAQARGLPSLVPDVDGLERAIDRLAERLRDTTDAARPPTPAEGTGCLVGDCRDGYGAQRFESGLTYEGTYADGEPDGAGRWLWPASAFWPDGAVDEGTWVRGVRQEPMPTGELVPVLLEIAEGDARLGHVAGPYGEPTRTVLGWQPSRWVASAALVGYRLGPALYARPFEGAALAAALAAARPAWRRSDSDDQVALADCQASPQRTVVVYRDLWVDVYAGPPDASVPDPCR